MGVLASLSVAEIKARGSIKDSDVAKLRKTFLEDSCVTAEDAEGLLSLNDACPIQDPAWQPCFVEFLADFVIDQTQPFGYMNTDNCAWLRERLGRSGKIEGKAKFDLLVSVLAKSRWIPQSLAVFALEQVHRAIADGTGPLRAGKVVQPLTVAESDVDALRQILQACGGEGNEGVSRAEAEVLFAIDVMTANSDNHPAWRDLFVAALACCIMAASGYAAPPRRVVMARDAWFDARADLDNIMSGMCTGDHSLLCAFKAMNREERAIARLTQQKIAIVTREEIPPFDAGWLSDYLAVHSHRTPNVMALLRFMKMEGRAIEPRLQQLVEQVPAAA